MKKWVLGLSALFPFILKFLKVIIDNYPPIEKYKKLYFIFMFLCKIPYKKIWKTKKGK